VSALTERFELTTGLVEDRWITGWEFMPGNRSIIEQAALWIVPNTLVGTWTPPDAARVYPSGVAERLPAGSRIALELHYKKSTTPQTDQSGVAFQFGRRPRRELRNRSLQRHHDHDIEASHDVHAGMARRSKCRAADAPSNLCVPSRYEPAPITYQFRKN
jgi:hypothetical protein